MNKIAVGFAFIFLSTISFSQTAEQRPKDIKDSPLIQARIAQQQTVVKADIKVSEYFNLESKITDVLINNTIPAGFPTSVTYNDKAKYIEVINSWLKQNPAFVKADKKNVTITE